MTLMQSQITFDILFKIFTDFIFTLHACLRSCAHQRSTRGHFCKDVTSHVTGKSLNSNNEKFPVIFITHNSAKENTFRCFGYTQRPKKKRPFSTFVMHDSTKENGLCYTRHAQQCKSKVFVFHSTTQKNYALPHFCLARSTTERLSVTFVTLTEPKEKALRYLCHANGAREKGFALFLSPTLTR